MFMRHYGNGVGHLQYEQQPEIEPDNGMALEDPTDNARESDSVVRESVEEEDEGGDWSESDIISDSEAKSDGSSCGGYASY